MNKSLLILKREYLTRVKTRSFIILTLLVPLLFAGIAILPVWLATRGDSEERNIAVYDASGMFLGRMESTEYTSFHFIPETEYNAVKNDIGDSNYYAVLYIPANILSSSRAQLFSDKQVTIEIESMIDNKLENIVENDKKNVIIQQSGIPDLEEKLAATDTSINLETIKINESGEETQSSTEIAMIVGYITGFIIYMFVMIYGAMVMRGVMEEKTSRIVEIIISSVKPKQLMFGKIIGIGLVGLTQLLFWIIIGFALITGISTFIGADQVESLQQSQNLMATSGVNIEAASAMQENAVVQAIEMINSLNIPLILGSFIFYFLGGFFVYASFMGAVGSAVDQEQDAQQLMTPFMLPLIFSIIIVASVIQNPESSLAFWTSMIPLTSPIIMMVRIPFGVPTWELILSMGILLLSIWGAILLAGKIYRTGILMYGKKVNFKEIVKWISYRN